jgi:hypothetical protein
MKNKTSGYILFSKMKEVAFKQLAWCDSTTFECPVVGTFVPEKVIEVLYRKFARGNDTCHFLNFNPETSMLQFEVLRYIGD